MGGTHGGGDGIEIDGFAMGSCCAVEDCTRQGEPQAQAATAGTHPEPLHLPGIGSDRGRQSAPCDESDGVVANFRKQAATVLLVVAAGEVIGFTFERAKTKASATRLGDYEAAVLKQQFASL